MKIYFALLLITLVFGHGLNVVEEKIEEEDRRELLVVASVAIAACISGVVGGIVGAVSGKGIDACGGRRDKMIVVIRDERTGEFKQQGRRRLLGGDVKAAAGDTNAASDTNAMGVLFDSNGVTCPSDAEHVVVALQKNSNDDGSHFFTIPNQYFDDKAFEKLPARQKENFQKLRTKTLPYNSNSLPSKKSTSWRPRNVLEIPAIQSLKTMLGLRRPDPFSRS